MTAACQSVNTPSGGAIGVERSAKHGTVVAVVRKQVEISAAESYAKEVAKARQENRLNTDTRNTQRINAIANA